MKIVQKSELLTGYLILATGVIMLDFHWYGTSDLFTLFDYIEFIFHYILHSILHSRFMTV